MDERKKLTEKYGMSPEEYTCKFLDTIEISYYLEVYCHEDAYDIMKAIEKDYSGSTVIQKANDLFGSFVFNWLNTEEFVDYINKRYEGKYQFVAVINYKIIKK